MAAEFEPASGGSVPFVGCMYCLQNHTTVINNFVPFDVRVYDTDGFIADGLLSPEGGPESGIGGSPIIPAGLDGFYLLEAIVYVDNQPIGPRVDPLAVDSTIASVIVEPSNSCDIEFHSQSLVYDPASYNQLKANGAFVRPLLAGESVETWVTGAALNVYPGIPATTITVTRLGSFPDGYVRPY